MEKEVSLLVKEARIAQVDGDLRRLGRIVNRTSTPSERGTILGMLAVEICLRRRDLETARHVLNMARRCFADDYHNLKVASEQSGFLNRFIEDPDFANFFMSRRAEMLAAGQL